MESKVMDINYANVNKLSYVVTVSRVVYKLENGKFI